jgi:hypothetical protein
MESSFCSLIPFLLLFCSCQFRRLDSIPFQAHILAGWHPETRLFTLDSTTVQIYDSGSYVTADGQPASLSWNKAPIWGLLLDLYYMCDSYGLVLVGRPLWREVGSVFCMCCWPLPAQSFSGPSPLGLETIFYCLTFEASLFVASYDTQGHGGGIRPRLHTYL